MSFLVILHVVHITQLWYFLDPIQSREYIHMQQPLCILLLISKE